MNLQNMHKYGTIVLLLTLLVSCNPKPTDSKQGVITYNIIYPEDIQSKSYATFLPSKMIAKFKGDAYKLTIKADLSLYKLEYISMANCDSAATLLKIFDKCLFENHQKGDRVLLFEQLSEAKVKLNKTETKEVAGYQCKKATIDFFDPDLEDLSAYYTTDIQLKKNKSNGPFDQIPGVLLAFEVPFKGLKLSFEAQEIDIKALNDKDFVIPKNYEQSNSGEIDELISALIQ